MLVFVKSSKMRKVVCRCAVCTCAVHSVHLAQNLKPASTTCLLEGPILPSGSTSYLQLDWWNLVLYIFAISLKLFVKGWKSAILPSQLVGFRKTGRLGRRSRWGDAAETEPLPPDSDPSEKLWCQRWRLDSNVDASSQLRGTLHGHCWWKRRQTNCRSMITYKKYQILIISWIIWDQEIIWLGVDKTAYKRNQSIIPHIASSWELVHQSFLASIKVPIWQWPGYWWTEAVCARGLLPNWWNSSKFPSSADQDCT